MMTRSRLKRTHTVKEEASSEKEFSVKEEASSQIEFSSDEEASLRKSLLLSELPPKKSWKELKYK